MLRFSFSLFIFLGCLTTSVFAATNSDYAAVTADGRGAVATVNPLATKAGIEAYAKGGNAIDAALAAAFTLGVVDSHNSGIGGGAFILVHLANGQILAIDGREKAPRAASRDMFVVDGKVDSQLSKTGPLAAGIPGSVLAYYQLLEAGGKLDFSQLILPAADIAENGFPIDRVLAARLKRTQEKLKLFPDASAIYLNQGKALKEGDKLVQQDLANTYRKLAQQGPDYFYRGDFAKKTAKWMKKNGGMITRRDFKHYHTVKRQPVRSRFRDYEVIGFPPPSSGGAHVAQILSMLDRFDLEGVSEVDRYHLVIEAMKLAFADRAFWMGDADFVNVPSGLVTEEYAKSLVAKIDINKASQVLSHGTPPNAEKALFNKHTTHIAAADKAGNWVAITTTLNTSFGSKVVIPETGVLLNNQMDDFVAQAGVPNAFGLVGAEANSIEAHKRPLSSMSPTLVLRDGQPVLTIGAAGGPTIISQVALGILNHLALGWELEKAMAYPRVHHQWQPDQVFIDPRASDTLVKGLEAKGHSLKVWPPFGATQGIGLKDGKLIPVAEPRIVSGER